MLTEEDKLEIGKIARKNIRLGMFFNDLRMELMSLLNNPDDEKVSYTNGERSNANMKLATTMESIDEDRLNQLSDKIKNMNDEGKLQAKNDQSLDTNKNINSKDVQQKGIKGKLDNLIDFSQKGKFVSND